MMRHIFVGFSYYIENCTSEASLQQKYDGPGNGRLLRVAVRLPDATKLEHSFSLGDTIKVS